MIRVFFTFNKKLPDMANPNKLKVPRVSIASIISRKDTQFEIGTFVKILIAKFGNLQTKASASNGKFQLQNPIQSEKSQDATSL